MPTEEPPQRTRDRSSRADVSLPPLSVARLHQPVAGGAARGALPAAGRQWRRQEHAAASDRGPTHAAARRGVGAGPARVPRHAPGRRRRVPGWPVPVLRRHQRRRDPVGAPGHRPGAPRASVADPRGRPGLAHAPGLGRTAAARAAAPRSRAPACRSSCSTRSPPSWTCCRAPTCCASCARRARRWAPPSSTPAMCSRGWRRGRRTSPS